MKIYVKKTVLIGLISRLTFYGHWRSILRIRTEKSTLKGQIPVPASKSHTIRATAIASLANGQSVIRNSLISSDTLSCVDCYRSLGAEIDTSRDDCWIVEGFAGKPAIPEKTIDVGNSGTTLRIAIGTAALLEKSQSAEFTGDNQIKSRPIGPLLDSLSDLGANAISLNDNGKAPVKIAGKLIGGKTVIQCTTSQYLSSLLLACPLAEQETTIDVSLLNEPDYAKMTLDWLDKQHIKYKNNDMKRFIIAPGQIYKPFDLSVPADFSSATFFLCAGAILGEVELLGLDFTDNQPDKSVIEYLKAMGASIEIQADRVTVKKSTLKGTKIDMNRTPDALPAMAVTALFAEGITELVNVPQARLKETDRIRCMAEELQKLGGRIEELSDGLIVHHSPSLKSTPLNGRSDHRIVMALSLAGMAISGTTEIDTAEAMNVTFPNYVDLMQKIGANMKII